jgi:hypothetical protein
MRRMLILGFATLTAGCASQRITPAPAPVPDAEPVPVEPAVQPPPDLGAQATLCFLDAREIDCDDIDAIALDTIDRLEVVKGAAAINRYGARAAGGVIVAHTRHTVSATLCFVDGQEFECDDFYTLDPDRIDRIEVVKGARAAELYGDRAFGGVILVSTKRL